MRSLVVDDDAIQRKIMERLLFEYGQCDTAADGREGVEYFRLALDQGLPYDLVCLDILMPEMDGQDALKEMRVLEVAKGIFGRKGARVFMTTSVDDSDQILEALTEDCEAYLVKPIAKEKFIKALQEAGLVD